MMICPPGVAKALTRAQSTIRTRTGAGFSDAADGEPLGETVERDAAGSAFALLHVAGELGYDAAPHGLARLLGQHAGDGLRRVQIEEPHAPGECGHDRDGCDARPQTEQALARRRKAVRSAPAVPG